jgi:hypothetical protein
MEKVTFVIEIGEDDLAKLRTHDLCPNAVATDAIRRALDENRAIWLPFAEVPPERGSEPSG